MFRKNTLILLLPALLSCSSSDLPSLPAPAIDTTIQYTDAGQDVVGISTVISELKARATPAVPTVIEVEWETSTPSTTIVKFGLTKDYARSTPPTTKPAMAHRALLLGLPSDSDVYFKVMSTPQGGATPTTATSQARTGPLPPALPKVNLALNNADRSAGGFTMIPMNQVGGSYLTIVDSLGRHVWFWGIMGALSSAHFSKDRQAVVLMEHGAYSATTSGKISRIPFDGRKQTSTSVPGLHTDFVEMADKEYAALSWEVRTYDGGSRKILGENIIEVSDSGQAKKVWSVFDHFSPDLSFNYSKGGYLADPDVEDWSHINGISYDEKEDAYYLTAGGLEAVIKVSRATSKVLWVLGRKNSTLNNGGDSSLVVAPHSIQNLGESILVFNRGHLNLGECSRATEITIDEKAAKASKKWSYTSKPCYQVYFLGNTMRLWNGNTLINWCTAGRAEEVTPSGELVWGVYVNLGAGFGFTSRVKSLY